MNRQEMLLIILQEELAEVSKEVSKVLRFGKDEICSIPSINPDKLTNSQRVTLEVADLFGVLEMLRDEGVIEYPMLYDIRNKKSKVEMYLKVSKELNILN